MVAVFVPALSSNVLSEHRLFNDATNRSNLELNYFHGCFSMQSCSKGLRLSVAEEQLWVSCCTRISHQTTEDLERGINRVVVHAVTLLSPPIIIKLIIGEIKWTNAIKWTLKMRPSPPLESPNR